MNNNNNNNNNILGMDPELAKTAARKMDSIKNALKERVEKSDKMLRERVNAAFYGNQSEAMEGFIQKVHAALSDLYKYLDSESTDSSFAIVYHKVIQSYIQSDENVRQSFANTQIEE